MPLFSVPWEVKLEEITRNFCKKIIKSEQVEENIVSIFKDMIFEYEDYSNYSSVLERNGFRLNGKYTVIAIYNKIEKAATDRHLRFHIEKIIHRINDLVVLFVYKNYRIIVLCDYSKDNINQLINDLKSNYFKSKGEENFVIGISSLECGLSEISISFKRAIETVELSIKKNEHIMYYDNLGIYQILFEANKNNVLTNFYNKILEPVEKYDNENNTSLLKFIKLYLENNGSVQAVADAMYVHRNTVNYQINKIKKITGEDLGDLDVKLSFLMCMYIKDII